MRSVYIHIPFCENICSYCDFCKMYYQKKWVIPYLNALQKEILNRYHGEKIETLYIGGGSPSCLTKEELERLFKIINKFRKSSKVEFTFECNVENITEEKLKLLYKYEVNRLSIGVQTFHKKYLKFLQRNHRKEDVYGIINLAKKVGFSNINVDFMYAFPHQKIEDVETDIRLFLELDVPHISMYSLILEPHTKLYINGTKEIGEDLDASMYEKICLLLKKYGYEHYEVSNFCKKGYASLHNLTYWNNEHYYGFGLGASGYIASMRYQNTRSLHNYIKGNYVLYQSILSKKDIVEHEWMLGFRKIKGISKKDFYSKYHKHMNDYYAISKLIKEGKLQENQKQIYINPQYIYVMNEILIGLLKESEHEND